jgi:hypothetical protein
MKQVPCTVAILFGTLTTLLTSCQTGQVELGNDGAIGGSTGTDGASENAFLAGQNGVIQVFVDDSRVYWVTRAENQLAPPTSFRSCVKDRCSSTIMSYLEETKDVGVLDVAIDNTNVYWLRGIYNGTSSAVLSCPHAGCASTPTSVIEGQVVNAANSLTSDGTFLYWTSPIETSVFRCEPDNCRTTLATLAQTQANPQSLIVSSGYAYWIASEGQASFAIRRTAVDGTLPVETIATGQNQTTSLAVREPYIYFNNRISVGTISACPVTGCNGKPTMFASGRNSPTSIVTDGEDVYWLNLGEPMLNQQTSLTRCAVSGCENPVPTLASFVSYMPSEAHGVTLDEGYVYWVATGAPQDASGRYGFPDAVIHRIAK